MNERSYANITKRDLRRLAQIALADRADFLDRNPRYRSICDDGHLLCIALCQGAALHYLDGCNGIKDFDVWVFYRRAGADEFPPRRPRSPIDFGDDKFGCTPGAKYAALVGRQVNLMGRSIDARQGEPPIETVRRYLRGAGTKSARELGKKPAVAIFPDALLGKVIWPVRG